MLDGELVAGPDPPLVGHVDHPGVDPVVVVGPGDHLATARRDPDQRLILHPELFGIARVDLHIARLIGQSLQGRAVAGHGAAGVVPHLAHGGEHQRVLGTGLLQRRPPLGGNQLTLAARGGEHIPLKQGAGARVILGRTGPLHALEIGHLVIADPGIERAESAQLVPDLLGVAILHGIPHGGGHQREDGPVRLHVVRRRHRLVEALEAAIRRAVDPLVLAPTGGGQNDVRHFGSLGHEDILHDHQLHPRQGTAELTEIGLGLGRIFPKDVEGLALALFHLVTKLRQPVTRFLGERIHTPRLGKLGADGRIAHRLIARELVRQHPHVAGALHVVLAAYRPAAGATTTEVAGQQRNTREPLDHVHRLTVLGHPHAPQDHGRRRRGIGANGGADIGGFEAGDPLHVFRGVLGDCGLEGVEPFGVVGDERLVVEPFIDQHIGEGVDQRHIGTVFERQPLIGDAGGLHHTGITHNHLGPVSLRLEDMAGDDGVRVSSIVTKHQQALGLLNFGNGVAHGAVAYRCLQTGD